MGFADQSLYPSHEASFMKPLGMTAWHLIYLDELRLEKAGSSMVQVPLRKLRLDGAACNDGGLVVISALPHLTSLHIGARHTHQVRTSLQGHSAARL